MGKQTAISWCDHTFNPWWGCTNVSPGCDHCYAEAFAKRTGHGVWGKDAPRRFFGEKHWAEPLQWNRAAEAAGVRRRVFCGSMCDVMEDRLLAELRLARLRLFELIAQTPYLDWLLLTKRPQNFRRFLPAGFTSNPWPNVWGMTTVESAEYLWRATELVNTPFAIRGLSMEPLLESVSLRWAPWEPLKDWGRTNHLDGLRWLDWVIVGGESGPHFRTFNPEWARTLRDECLEAGVPFFFKQHGGRFPTSGGDLLDGVEWKQVPSLEYAKRASARH